MSRGRSTTHKRRRRVKAWLIWFAALSVLWVVLISAWVPEEEVLGVFAAALGATAAAAVREQGVAGFRLRLRWLLRARVLPIRAMRETGFVCGALVRQLRNPGRVRGTFRVRPVRLPDDSHEQAAKQALLIAGESFAPNAYVVAIDPREGLMLTHELVCARTGEGARGGPGPGSTAPSARGGPGPGSTAPSARSGPGPGSTAPSARGEPVSPRTGAETRDGRQGPTTEPGADR